MRRFCGDIASHWRSATLFTICWAGVWAITAFTWRKGVVFGPMAMQTVLPLAAGALVGWWRATPDGTMQRPCWVLGAFVGWVNISILFAVDWVRTSEVVWEWDAFAIWLGVGAVFGAIGATLGMAGGVLGQLAVRPSGGSTPPTSA
jgi:hypothetical protein